MKKDWIRNINSAFIRIVHRGRQLVGQMRDQNPELFEAASAAAANSGLGDFNPDSSNNGPDQAPPAP